MVRRRVVPIVAAVLVGATLAACSDDGGTGVPEGAFGTVQSIMGANNCRSCHNPNNSVFHGGFELVNERAADSLMVSRFLDFEAPEQSPFVQRNIYGSDLLHPIRPFDSAADADAQSVVSYAEALAAAGASRLLTAAKVTSGPVVDGVAESAWNSATGIEIPIGGGFAGAINVTMKAMYVPGDRVYFLFTWDDPTESLERAPWLLTASGWLHQPVTPGLYNNENLAYWRTQPAGYLYEDKLAVIWNTTGASAVDGFNENGCAVLCHVNRPGDARPLKYTNEIGQTADMWHWKLVRLNALHHIDDQYVWWNRDLAVSSNGGRAGDPGGSEYASNSTLVTLSNGAIVPRYTSNNMPNRFYMVDSATAAQWAATSPGFTIDPNDIARLTTTGDNYVVGDRLAYPIATLKPNVDRSHIEAFGAWSAGRWTLEVSRPLVTNSTGGVPTGQTAAVPVDVQFTPGETYHFGIAVFENAQIEHSWSPAVYRFRFQP